MTIHSLRSGSLARLTFVSCGVLLAAPLVSGCELFVHFDRTRIGGDTGIDAGTRDGGPDTGRDVGVDANVDANTLDMGARDTGPDMGVDVGVDVGVDANRPDTGVDAGCVTPSLDCPATGNECVVPMCSGGGCTTMNLTSAHVLSTGQTAANCQRIVCNGSGGMMSMDDATDLPAASGSLCRTTPACTGSPLAPSYTNASAGTTCTDSGGRVCDGAGACVACNAPSDCPATSGECVLRTCTTHVCGTMNANSGVVRVSGQTAGDCQVLQCNGSGGTMSVNDATDLPSASGSMCRTTPACTGSPLAPSYTNATIGTACTDSGGALCNGTGMCVACNTIADCAGAATPICDGTTHMCRGCSAPAECTAKNAAFTMCTTGMCS